VGTAGGRGGAAQRRGAVFGPTAGPHTRRDARPHARQRGALQASRRWQRKAGGGAFLAVELVRARATLRAGASGKGSVRSGRGPACCLAGEVLVIATHTLDRFVGCTHGGEDRGLQRAATEAAVARRSGQWAYYAIWAGGGIPMSCRDTQRARHGRSSAALGKAEDRSGDGRPKGLKERAECNAGSTAGTD